LNCAENVAQRPAEPPTHQAWFRLIDRTHGHGWHADPGSRRYSGPNQRSNLYVAGTPQGANALTGPGPACPLSRCGTLTVINTGSLTASTTIPITDGQHQNMTLANNRVYIGAATCTVDPGTAATPFAGALPSSTPAHPAQIFPNESAFRQNFDVTGLQPITGRNVIYIVQVEKSTSSIPPQMP